MRLLVVSDTHGNCTNLVFVIKLLGKSTDALLHLGDGINDPKKAMTEAGIYLPYYGVCGNTDIDRFQPLVRHFIANGFPIIMAHGHRYAIGESTNCLFGAAREAGAKAFFFGHSHIPEYRKHKDIIILNPGSLSRPRGIWGPSFAVVEASPEYLDIKLFEIIFTSSDKSDLRTIHLD